MAGKKSEQIKLYLVIGLALVFVICAYFRFIRPKAESGEDISPLVPPTAEHVKFDIPKTETKSPQNCRNPRATVHERIQMAVRDIFSPQTAPKKTENHPREQRSRNTGSSLKLAGTIVGGESPIAVINNQFVRTGDWIGEFRVVRIGKKDVLLDSGGQKMALEIMKNE